MFAFLDFITKQETARYLLLETNILQNRIERKLERP